MLLACCGCLAVGVGVGPVVLGTLTGATGAFTGGYTW